MQRATWQGRAACSAHAVAGRQPRSSRLLASRNADVVVAGRNARRRIGDGLQARGALPAGGEGGGMGGVATGWQQAEVGGENCFAQCRAPQAKP